MGRLLKINANWFRNIGGVVLNSNWLDLNYQSTGSHLVTISHGRSDFGVVKCSHAVRLISGFVVLEEWSTSDLVLPSVVLCILINGRRHRLYLSNGESIRVEARIDHQLFGDPFAKPVFLSCRC